jgi:BMFP domain-containing protein YqiC
MMNEATRQRIAELEQKLGKAHQAEGELLRWIQALEARIVQLEKHLK